MFIAAHFNWKACGLDSLSKEINTAAPWLPSSHPCDVGQISIEMTLTTRRVQLGNIDMERREINENRLTDEAFLPNKLTLRLEKGRFMTAKDEPIVSDLPCYKTFNYRLSCEPSPLPARHMWKDPSGAPDQIQFWEWNQFQSHERSVQWQSTQGGKIFNTCKRVIELD